MILDPVTDKLLSDGARAKLKDGFSQAVKDVMFHIASNPLMLNEVVAQGPYDWRVKFIRAMKPLPVDEPLANAVYSFFEQKAGGRYAAKVFMDKVEVTVETDAERDKRQEENWFLTSHSSEAAKRHYGLPTGTGPMRLSDLRGMVRVNDYDVDQLNTRKLK